MSSLTDFPVTLNKEQIDKQYRYWRIRITYSLVMGYAVFYLTRKTFTYAMPYIAQDLAFSKAQLGALGSILYLAYGISKFINGAISDRSNPRYFMAIGLILTGLCNIAFGLSSSFWLFAIFWGLNGWFQAWGWPACCKCLTYWFNRTERGFWYSIVNTSHNLGGAVIPIITVFFAINYGWRWAMFIPAGISILMGLLLINRLRDIPQTLGLPPVDKKHVDTIVPEKMPRKLTLKEIMFNNVLKNKYVWLFAITNFFVYFIRTAVSDWSVLYMMEDKEAGDLLASQAPFWFETMGIVGMILAGLVSDIFHKGNRIPVIIMCGIGMLISIVGLWMTPPEMVYLDFVLFALLGFFVFGPQSIVGLAASECVDKRASSSANGFAGTLGYLGAAFAGFPIGYSIDSWGWMGYFAPMIACSIFIFCLLFPFSTRKESMQRKLFAT